MLLPYARDLTDTQWAILDLFIPEPVCRKDVRGASLEGPAYLNAILWALRTGAPWCGLPEGYAPIKPVNTDFNNGCSQASCGVYSIAEGLRIRGLLDVREAFIDGSFTPAKKRARRLAKQSVAKAPKSWPWWIGTACP